jgi:hypothetical protein
MALGISQWKSPVEVTVDNLCSNGIRNIIGSAQVSTIRAKGPGSVRAAGALIGNGIKATRNKCSSTRIKSTKVSEEPVANINIM